MPPAAQPGASVAVQQANPPKKKDKILCFQCMNTGHFAVDCMVDLCIYCDKALHMSKDYPLLTAPKAVAVMYELENDNLMYFDVLKSDDVRVNNDSGSTGRIRVSEAQCR